MKNARQIQLIHKTLTKEKDGFLFELGKLNKTINNKLASIQRMIAYEKEYLQGDNLKLSKTKPALSKNLQSFTKQINDVVKQAQYELDTMHKTQTFLHKQIEEIDKKIELMKVFNDRIKVNLVTKANKAEQTLLDDLAGILHLRGDHD